MNEMENLEKIISLEDETIKVIFKDGCSLDIKIISTSHIKEGGDVVGQVKKLNCCIKDHNHPLVGSYINFKVDEIESYKLMTKR